MAETLHKAKLRVRKDEEDMHCAANRVPHYVYRLYDKRDTLLYVGISKDVKRRLGDHRRRQPWWPTVARVEADRHRSRSAALYHEAVFIHSHRPAYNVHGRAPGSAPAPYRHRREWLEAVVEFVRGLDEEAWQALSAARLMEGAAGEAAHGALRS